MMFRKRHPPPGAPPGALVPRPDAPPPKLLVTDYTADTVQERSLASLDELSPQPDVGVRWLSLQGLGDETLLHAIGERFAIHPLALADVVNTPQRPKLDPYEDHVLLIARAARWTDEHRLVVQQVSLVMRERCVITFEEEHGDLLAPVRERLRRHAPLAHAGADFLAQAIVDTVIDGYYPLLEDLGEELERLEEDVINRPSRRVLHRIHRVKTGLLTARRGIWPQRDAIQAVLRQDSELFTAASSVYFRDSYDHAAQVVDVVESYRDIAAGLMEVYLTSISNRSGEVMKVLTVIATIFIPLTFLVGIYGMNFPWMPELKFWWAYPVLWVVMVVIGGLMLLYFWRRGWLTRDETGLGPHAPPPGKPRHADGTTRRA